MKLSRLVLSAAIALVSSSGFAANLGPLDLTTGSAGFSNTPIAGSFVDTYTFTLTATFVATASITSVVSGAQDVDFTAITVTGPSGTFSFNQLLPDPVEVWSLSATTLGAGTYTLSLTGTNSAAIGSYGGNFAVTPVPEPETLALMFAGLGAVGFMARRRNSASV